MTPKSGSHQILTLPPILLTHLHQLISYQSTRVRFLDQIFCPESHSTIHEFKVLWVFSFITIGI